MWFEWIFIKYSRGTRTVHTYRYICQALLRSQLNSWKLNGFRFKAVSSAFRFSINFGMSIFHFWLCIYIYTTIWKLLINQMLFSIIYTQFFFMCLMHIYINYYLCATFPLCLNFAHFVVPRSVYLILSHFMHSLAYIYLYTRNVLYRPCTSIFVRLFCLSLPQDNRGATLAAHPVSATGSAT